MMPSPLNAVPLSQPVVTFPQDAAPTAGTSSSLSDVSGVQNVSITLHQPQIPLQQDQATKITTIATLEMLEQHTVVYAAPLGCNNDPDNFSRKTFAKIRVNIKGFAKPSLGIAALLDKLGVKRNAELLALETPQSSDKISANTLMQYFQHIGYTGAPVMFMDNPKDYLSFAADGSIKTLSQYLERIVEENPELIIKLPLLSIENDVGTVHMIEAWNTRGGFQSRLFTCNDDGTVDVKQTNFSKPDRGDLLVLYTATGTPTPTPIPTTVPASLLKFIAKLEKSQTARLDEKVTVATMEMLENRTVAYRMSHGHVEFPELKESSSKARVNKKDFPKPSRGMHTLLNQLVSKKNATSAFLETPQPFDKISANNLMQYFQLVGHPGYPEVFVDNLINYRDRANHDPVSTLEGYLKRTVESKPEAIIKLPLLSVEKGVGTVHLINAWHTTDNGFQCRLITYNDDGTVDVKQPDFSKPDVGDMLVLYETGKLYRIQVNIPKQLTGSATRPDNIPENIKINPS